MTGLDAGVDDRHGHAAPVGIPEDAGSVEPAERRVLTSEGGAQIRRKGVCPRRQREGHAPPRVDPSPR